MNETTKDVEAARSAAGHNAYRIVEQYGAETGALILRSVAMSYLRALAAVEGWPSTLDLVREQYTAHFVPVRGQKLQLAYSRDTGIEKVAS